MRLRMGSLVLPAQLLSTLSFFVFVMRQKLFHIGRHTSTRIRMQCIARHIVFELHLHQHNGPARYAILTDAPTQAICVLPLVSWNMVAACIRWALRRCCLRCGSLLNFVFIHGIFFILGLFKIVNLVHHFIVFI